MKKWIGAVLLVTSFLGAESALADSRFIVVTTSAERGMEPNMVNLNVEVWSKAVTAKQAQQLAATQFKQVQKVINDYKIKKEDFGTENYSLNPEYEYDQSSRQNKMVGFRVVQSMSVVLRKTEEAGNFLDALVSEKKGANSGVNVNSISWDSDKRDQVETATLGDAVRGARTKAEELAKAAGVRIKGVSKISHGSAGIQPPQTVFREFGMKAMASSDAATALAAGQVKVRVDVTVEYEIN